MEGWTMVMLEDRIIVRYKDTLVWSKYFVGVE